MDFWRMCRNVRFFLSSRRPQGWRDFVKWKKAVARDWSESLFQSDSVSRFCLFKWTFHIFFQSHFLKCFFSSFQKGSSGFIFIVSTKWYSNWPGGIIYKMTVLLFFRGTHKNGHTQNTTPKQRGPKNTEQKIAIATKKIAWHSRHTRPFKNTS